MIESLHTRMMVNVRNGGEVSDTFAIINDVRQWCVLTPTLLSILLLEMLEEAFRDMGDGVYIQSECIPLYNCTLQSEDKKYKYTWKRTAFSRRQRTDCLLSIGDP